MPTYYYAKDKPFQVSDSTVSITPATFYPNGTLWEQTSLSYFFDLVAKKDGPVNIVDVGAQSGLYTLYAKYLPQCHFFSYEPNPETFILLQQNCALNSIHNVDLNNQGIGEAQTTLTLKVPLKPNEKGLCCFGATPKRFDTYSEVQVKVTTLDDEFFHKDIPVHFIKADTEGWEAHILRGGLKTLQKWKPELFLEVNDTNLAQCGSSRHEIEEILQELGYTFVQIVDEENYHYKAKV